MPEVFFNLTGHGKYYIMMPPTYRSADPVAPYRIAGYDDAVFAGMGSAYGGKWKPKKELDELLVGSPGEIKSYITPKGEKFESAIGENGKANVVRHNTDHCQPAKHSPVHDHIITWIGPDEHPNYSSPVNYWDGVVPELTTFIRSKSMGTIIYGSNEPEYFESAGQFKRSLEWGAEIQFEWKGVDYCCVRYGTDNKITICEAYKPETEKVCETADDALEYIVSGDRLRDVITKVVVTECTVWGY